LWNCKFRKFETKVAEQALIILGSEFHFSYVSFASKMFDDIYYFPSHFDQFKIQNFGLLKCVVKFYFSGTHFNIHSGQPKYSNCQCGYPLQQTQSNSIDSLWRYSQFISDFALFWQ
jgi:hypothetical protein